MLNTHFYDGKITNELSYVKDLSLTDKHQCGQDLLILFEHKPAKHFLNIIVNDMGTDANVDYTNQLNADDLICLCWIHRENEVFIKEFEVQLLDMATGFCPQGRTHRLYQLLLAFD